MDLADAYLLTRKAGAQNGPPASPANNPQAQVDTGLVVAQVLVKYLSIARVFLVNMQSGQTVVLPATTTAATAV